MKKSNLILSVIFLLLGTSYLMASGGSMVGEINQWKSTAKTVGRAVMGLAAIGGAVIVYFKMQSDDGTQGKKALMSYVGALIFAALAWTVIETILN